MAIATLLTGIFLFLFTISAKSDFQLAFQCLVAFVQNIMYAVLYAYTPETFPGKSPSTQCTPTCADDFQLRTVAQVWHCVLLQPHCWPVRATGGHLRRVVESQDTHLWIRSSYAVGIHLSGLLTD